MDEHGFTLGMNIEEGPASRGFSEWGTSAVDDRKQRILAALPEICPETGVPRDLVRVELVEGPRVTLSLSRTIPEADKGRYLLLQELHLRTTVDPRIELFLHDRKDANAKRQGVL